VAWWAVAGLALGPSALAILAGAVGARAVLRRPERMRGFAAAVAGITLGGVTLALNLLGLFLVNDLLRADLAGRPGIALDGYVPAAETRVREPAGASANPITSAYSQGLQVLESDPTLALQLFDEALSYDPSFGPALLERGRLHARQRDFKSSERDFDELLRIEPENAEGWVERARAHQGNDDAVAALADWQRYLAIEPAGTHAVEARAAVRRHQDALEGK